MIAFLALAAFGLNERFEREVVPILSASCIECHSDTKRKGGLRLDTREGVLSVVQAGKLEASELHVRLLAAADDGRMPDGREALPASQVQAIADWIEAGAVVPEGWTYTSAEGQTQASQAHWAYAPLQRTEALRTARNPIDPAVAAAWTKAGLQGQGRADERTLVRRLSLDLRGLPPTPEEVEAYLLDPRTDRWERLVSTWLDSSAYAERMTQWWLDLARYADTNGYEKDDRRTHWRWRDWVIDSFTRNQPFDDFTLEQLAGDLLPEATLEQRLATGFHRNTLVNQEGGVDPEEFRTAALVDRVNTTSTVWLGSTIACAQCHNHKYDPFSQREYYRLYAYFDRTIETGAGLDPLIAAPTPAQAQALRAAEAEVAQAQATREAAAADLEAEFRAWVDARHVELQFSSEGPPPAAAWMVYGPIELGARQADPTRSVARELGLVEGATRVLELTAASLTGARHELVTPNTVAVYTLTTDSYRSGTATVRLAADDRVRVWVDGQLVFENAEWDRLNAPAHSFTFAQRSGTHQVVAEVWNGGGAGGFYGEVELEGPLGLPRSLVLALVQSERSAGDIAALRAWHRQHAAPRAAALDERVTRAEEALKVAQQHIPTAMVLQDSPTPRTTRVLAKGSHRAPQEAVEPGVPEVLSPLPADAGSTRLDLARWLVADDQPLTPRVIVNRLWALAFGRGLVDTVDDFGVRGDAPTHPELLDELAARFVESGWDLHAVWRLILTSETYKRNARVEPRQQELDPKNQWLARAPRLRLEIETLRDAQLAMAGLLSSKVGGPSVMPPQPEGVWAPVYSSDRWTTAEDEDRYRRGLYTFWKRSSPYATFMTFDAPSREVSCTRRERTNTPLQALALLNDPAFVECAAGLAVRAFHAGTDERSRAERMWLIATSRVPDSKELDTTLRLLALERGRAQAAPEQVQQLLAANRSALERSAKDSKASPDSIPPHELAAWIAVANMLLNLDEVVVRG